MQVQVTVTSNTKRCRRKDLVSAIHAGGVVRYQVGKKNIIIGSFRRKLYQAGQSARYSNHTYVCNGTATTSSEQKSHTQGLINYPRKGMSRIHRNRCEQRIGLAPAVIV